MRTSYKFLKASTSYEVVKEKIIVKTNIDAEAVQRVEMKSIQEIPRAIYDTENLFNGLDVTSSSSPTNIHASLISCRR